MIPNITGYAGFRSYKAIPCANMKPGQFSLYRDYYKDVATDHPGTASMINFSRYGTVYNDKLGETVTPKSYSNSSTLLSSNHMVNYDYAHRPDLLAYMSPGVKITNLSHHTTLNPKRITKSASTATLSNRKILVPLESGRTTTTTTTTNLEQTNWGTSPVAVVERNITKKWESTYRSNSPQSPEGSPKQPRGERPQWSFNRAAYSSHRLFKSSEYNNNLGFWGQNPRSKLTQAATKMKNPKHELTMGTSKVTRHPPGYTGFLPHGDYNSSALKQGKCKIPRTTIIKQNIVQN